MECFIIKIQEVLTEKQLAGFVGGYSDKDCLMDIGKSSAWNALKGGIAETAFGIGVGNAARAFVGTYVGVIKDSVVCFSKKLIG